MNTDHCSLLVASVSIFGDRHDKQVMLWSYLNPGNVRGGVGVEFDVDGTMCHVIFTELQIDIK